MPHWILLPQRNSDAQGLPRGYQFDHQGCHCVPTMQGWILLPLRKAAHPLPEGSLLPHRNWVVPTSLPSRNLLQLHLPDQLLSVPPLLPQLRVHCQWSRCSRPNLSPWLLLHQRRELRNRSDWRARRDRWVLPHGPLLPSRHFSPNQVPNRNLQPCDLRHHIEGLPQLHRWKVLRWNWPHHSHCRL